MWFLFLRIKIWKYLKFYFFFSVIRQKNRSFSSYFSIQHLLSLCAIEKSEIKFTQSLEIGKKNVNFVSIESFSWYFFQTVLTNVYKRKGDWGLVFFRSKEEKKLKRRDSIFRSYNINWFFGVPSIFIWDLVEYRIIILCGKTSRTIFQKSI